MSRLSTFMLAVATSATLPVMVFAAEADTYTWIPGSTDWASEDSYVEDGKPGQGDIVLIPAGEVATNKVVANDAASLASFEAFSKLIRSRLGQVQARSSSTSGRACP